MNRTLTTYLSIGTFLTAGMGFSLITAGCDQIASETEQIASETLGDTLVTDDYEATAITTYTWRAEYRPRGVTPDRPNEGRTETFESSYRVNINGQPAVQDFGDADEKGLWWPALPPKPTVDDLEARLKKREVFEEPLISKSVRYTLTFDQAGEMVTLRTDYPVYREAVKGQQAERSLKLTLGRQEAYVRKAEMQ